MNNDIQTRIFWEDLNINKNMKVKIKVYNEKEASLPTYGSVGAAAFDIKANEEKIIMPGETQIIKTGLFFELPEGYMLNIATRSGMATKGIVVANSWGILDADYRGELMIILHNSHVIGSKNVFKVVKGDRIAQGLVLPVPQVEFEVVKSKSDLSSTERGEGKFGSTGVK